jgi:hypothetical protein
MWHGHLARGIFRHGLEARATMGAEIRSTYCFAAPDESRPSLDDAESDSDISDVESLARVGRDV